MAKVVMFPTKKRLPKGVEDEITRIAKEYVAALRAAAILMDLETEKPTQEEMMKLVADAFTDGIYEAIEEME